MTVGRIISLLAGLSAILILAGSADSPGQDRPQGSALQHEVSVNLKLVFVRVTDATGRPVEGLTAADFELKDNGQVKKITEFEAHYEAVEPAPAHPESEPSADEVTAAEPPIPELVLGEDPFPEFDKNDEDSAPAALPNPEETGIFFFLIDEDNNDLTGLAKSRELAARLLKTQLRPGDMASILTWSNWGGVKVQLDLTPDLQKAAAVLAGMKLMPGRDIDETYDAYDGTAGPVVFPELGTIDSALEMRIKSTRFSRQISELAKTLGGIPGRKNLILFSWGIPRYLLKRNDVRLEFEDLGREMATAATPIISVNTERPKPKPMKKNEFLMIMSEYSGGIAFGTPGDRNLAVHIDRTVRAFTRCYYVLGYSIQDAWDGKFHKIAVRAKKPGCLVRTMEGYFNPQARRP